MVQLSVLSQGLVPSLPDIGWHAGMSSGTYHSIQAASSHRLGLIKKSAAHLRHEIDNPTPPTAAMKLGEAMHCAILEYNVFIKKYVVAPRCDRRTKEGKATHSNFELENVGKISIDFDDYASCMAMADACMSHQLAANLINSATAREISGFFLDSASGTYSKMRADAICGDHSTLFDIKSTVCAAPFDFESSIYKYGYHRQGAFYLDGAAALGQKLEHYAIIAIEKVPPFALAVYRLTDEAIELGRRENAELMEVYAKCIKTNVWSGYPLLITDVGLPVWAQKQIKRSLTNEN